MDETSECEMPSILKQSSEKDEYKSENSSCRVLELYSGIGGIHYSLHAASIPHVIVGACDINTVANEIYRFNFPHSCHFQKNILSVSASEIDEMKPDLLTMSPPCQPFTRIGLKNDCDDSRTASFLHVLNTLKLLNYKPNCIFLENVKGFETSKTHSLFLDALTDCDYMFQEFLLSPVQFGIPNSRLRYYLLAKKCPSKFCFQTSSEIIENIPLSIECPSYGSEPEKLLHYIQTDCELDPYLIPDKLLLKYVMVMDIVQPHDRRSCCFTKAYSHYAQGTGSVLQSNNINMSSIFGKISNQMLDAEKLKLLKLLKLRYFTPREVANLMCFPASFKFPLDISKKQQYQVLGNSVNIKVISELLKILLCEG